MWEVETWGEVDIRVGWAESDASSDKIVPRPHPQLAPAILASDWSEWPHPGPWLAESPGWHWPRQWEIDTRLIRSQAELGLNRDRPGFDPKSRVTRHHGPGDQNTRRGEDGRGQETRGRMLSRLMPWWRPENEMKRDLDLIISCLSENALLRSLLAALHLVYKMFC